MSQSKVYLICNKDDVNLFHDGRLTCDWVPLERAKFYHREGDAKGALTQCRKHAENNDLDFNAEIARGEIYFVEDAKPKEWQEVEVSGRGETTWVDTELCEYWDCQMDITKQEGSGIANLEDDNSQWRQDLRNEKAKHIATHEELKKAFKWVEDVWVFKETRAIRNEEELRAMREWLDKNFPRKDGRPRKSFIKWSDK